MTGGSLGAQHINEVVASGAAAFAGRAQILHATGTGKADEISVVAANSPGVTWVIREYISNMEDALAAADLVLCRSGAGTVAELGALGLPAFYVPLPIGNGEQRRNAEGQVAAGGAGIALPAPVVRTGRTQRAAHYADRTACGQVGRPIDLESAVGLLDR